MTKLIVAFRNAVTASNKQRLMTFFQEEIQAVLNQKIGN